MILNLYRQTFYISTDLDVTSPALDFISTVLVLSSQVFNFKSPALGLTSTVLNLILPVFGFVCISKLLDFSFSVQNYGPTALNSIFPKLDLKQNPYNLTKKYYKCMVINLTSPFDIIVLTNHSYHMF